jgi:hypothetical protein
MGKAGFRKGPAFLCTLQTVFLDLLTPHHKPLVGVRAKSRRLGPGTGN